jgi:biotin carboxyl carrier protein
MENKLWQFDGQNVKSAEGAVIKWDNETFFTLTYNGKKFFGEILKDDTEGNVLELKINHRVFTIKKKGPLDELIAAMGLDVPKVRKLKELQAPMPGRVVQIEVKIGQEVQVGEPILSLEAMKMENVLKAEGVGVVKEILVEANQIVDKGAVMIVFE